MGQFIIKLKDAETDVYMLWSTVVDAPVVIFDDRDDIATWTKDEYGNKGLSELPARMARVDEKGTSSLLDRTAQESISGNRAGRDETQITEDQIIQWYWRDKMEGEKPWGLKFNPESGEYEEAPEPSKHTSN